MFRSFSVAFCTAFIAYLINGTLIQGPLPMSVVAPIGEIVELHCTVNISELKGQTGGGSFAFLTWLTSNQSLLNDINPILTGGEIKTSTARVHLTEEYTSGISFRCIAFTLSPWSETTSNTSAILTAYGMYNVIQNTELPLWCVYYFLCYCIQQVVHNPH